MIGGVIKWGDHSTQDTKSFEYNICTLILSLSLLWNGLKNEQIPIENNVKRHAIPQKSTCLSQSSLPARQANDSVEIRFHGISKKDEIISHSRLTVWSPLLGVSSCVISNDFNCLVHRNSQHARSFVSETTKATRKARSKYSSLECLNAQDAGLSLPIGYRNLAWLKT